MTISRRLLLKTLGAGIAAMSLPGALRADPRRPVSSPAAAELDALESDFWNTIGSLEIGLDLRRVDRASGEELFRLQINADKLYPVASCFKIFLVLYYFWHTPRAAWDYGPGSPVYRTAVFSDNVMTAVLLDEMARYITFYGNAIQKFNDFLIFTMEMEQGLYSWNWENSRTVFQTDSRFAASSQRYVEVRGLRYAMDNLTTAADLANGYARLLQPATFTNYEHAAEAIEHTLELFSIPASNYQSPFERVFPQGYTGKDGVLPARDSAIGRVINDAGIIQMQNGTYILTFLCAGEGEYVGLQVLRQLAASLRGFDAAAG
jgi:hypothetical protein